MKKVNKPEGSSPTLRTINMVENTLDKMEYTEVKVAQLKRILPKKVNHNTLMQVLDHLLDHNRIIMGTRGITYIHNPHPKMRKALANAVTINPEDIREFLRKLDKR